MPSRMRSYFDDYLILNYIYQTHVHSDHLDGNTLHAVKVGLQPLWPWATMLDENLQL